MNCAALLQQIGFDCAERPGGGLRVFSPFSFADGTCLGAYIEPLGSGNLLVTDHGDTFMYLSEHGIDPTWRKLRWASERCAPVQVSEGGVLRLVAEPDNVGVAVANLLDAAIRIGHQQAEWKPVVSQNRFVDVVADEISAVAPGRVEREVTVVGISGHQLQFPLGVVLPDRVLAFVQPISSHDDKLDWQTVYRTAGKMGDLQQAGIAPARRLVVIDDESAPDEAPRAMTLLNYSATVLPFSQRSQWLERLAA